MQALLIRIANPFVIDGVDALKAKSTQWVSLTRLAVEIRNRNQEHLERSILELNNFFEEDLKDIVQELSCPILQEHKDYKVVRQFVYKIAGKVDHIHDSRIASIREIGSHYLDKIMPYAGNDNKEDWLIKFNECLEEIKEKYAVLKPYLEFISAEEAKSLDTLAVHELGCVKLYQFWNLAKSENSEIEPISVHAILWESATAYPGETKQFEGVDYSCFLGLEKRIELFFGQIANSEKTKISGAELKGDAYSDLVREYVHQNIMLLGNGLPSTLPKEELKLLTLNMTVSNFMKLKSREYLLACKKSGTTVLEDNIWDYTEAALKEVLGSLSNDRHWLSKAIFGESSVDVYEKIREALKYVIEEDLDESELLELKLKDESQRSYTVTLLQLEEQIKNSVLSIEDSYIKLVSAWAGGLKSQPHLMLTSEQEIDWIVNHGEIFSICDKNGSPFLHQLLNANSLTLVDYIIRARDFKVEYLDYIDTRGRTVLHLAMKKLYGVALLQYCICSSLLENSYFMRRDGAGLTVLHYAVMEDRLDSWDLLIDSEQYMSNALFKALDSHGRTILHYAMCYSDKENRNLILTEILKNKHFRSEMLLMQDSEGRTPLHIAFASSNYNGVSILLDQIALPISLFRLQDNEGNTILHKAIGGSAFSIASDLLIYDIPREVFTISNNSNFLVLDLALYFEEEDSDELAREILKHPNIDAAGCNTFEFYIFVIGNFWLWTFLTQLVCLVIHYLTIFFRWVRSLFIFANYQVSPIKSEALKTTLPGCALEQEEGEPLPNSRYKRQALI